MGREIFVRSRLLVSLDFFDVAKGNSVLIAGDPPLSVVITPQTGGPANRAEAEVIQVVEVSAAVMDELRAIPPDRVSGIRSSAVDAFAAPIEERHRAAAGTAVELARWRLRGHGDHRSVGGLGMTDWSEDQTDWRRIPRDLRPTGTARVPPSLPVASIEELSNQAIREPVGHALLREAIGNVFVNPRSSLVVGVAALEVGLKEAIADFDPLAGWLAEHSPTPPVERMLKEVLPLLPARLEPGWRAVAPPAAVRTVVGRAIAARNGIVHVGRPGFDRAELETFLDLVGDLLYMLDFYRGQPWAVTRIHNKGIVSAMRDPKA